MSGPIRPEKRQALAHPLRRPIGLAATFAGLVFVMLAARFTGDDAAGRLDIRLRAEVQALLPETGVGGHLIRSVGDPVNVIVLAGLLMAGCLALGRRRLAALAILGPGLTGVATIGLKPVIGRMIYGGDFAGPTLSYPSGHTAAVTALALVGMLLVVDLLRVGALLGLVLIVAGALGAGAPMALTLVADNIHYPTDTVGGFCTAMVVVPAAGWLVDRFVGTRPVGGADHTDL